MAIKNQFAHNAGVVNNPRVEKFIEAFKKHPRFVPEDLKKLVRNLRVFAVFCPDAECVLHLSDKYSECEKMVKSLLIPAFVVRFDPVLF